MNKQKIQKKIEQDVRDVWQPDHTDDGHFYVHQDEGVRVGSVTGKNIVEQPHLIKWAARLSAEHMADNGDWLGDGANEETVNDLIQQATLAYKDERDGAADVGTQVHNNLEKTIVSEGEYATGHSENDQVTAATRSGIKAIDEEPIEPIAAELTVGSLDLQVAGTLDLLCLFDDELTVVDWKTSNSMSDTYAMQLATYGGLLESMTDLSVKNYKIIKLDKNRPKYTVYNLRYPRRAFAAAKRVYKVADYLDADYEKLRKRGNKSITI